MILVTGAGGKTGRAVIRALHTCGADVRAMVHRPGLMDALKGLGACEVVLGDMMEMADMQRAFRGVSAVYHICPNVSPHEVTIAELALQAAREAQIKHFVYHSVLHPQIESMPHHWLKLRVEEKLFESGLAFTILQPAAYMQNILAYWQGICEQGVFSVPYRAEARSSMVDLEDVAQAAARVLTQPGHHSAIYELVGPEALDQNEIAGTLSRALGRPVRVETQPLEDWERQARASGMGAYQLETLLGMFRHYDRFNFSGSPKVLGWLLERPPVSFADFVSRVLAES